MSPGNDVAGKAAIPLAAIFDMDGVLIDSIQLNWRAINEVLAAYNVHVDDDQISSYLGRTLKDQVARFNDVFGLRLEYEAFEAETNRIKERLFTTLRPKDGVLKLLSALKSVRVPLAVGTSMPRTLTEDRLSRVGVLHFFDALVTEEDVEYHKPAPDVYLAAAKALGMIPAACIVFEDAPTGVASAKSALTKCVAVITPYVSVEQLRAADMTVASLADITVDDLRELVGAK